MAFPHHAAVATTGNQLPVALEGGFGPGLEVVQLHEQIRIVNHRPDLVEIFLHGGEYGFRSAKRLVVRHRR